MAAAAHRMDMRHVDRLLDEHFPGAARDFRENVLFAQGVYMVGALVTHMIAGTTPSRRTMVSLCTSRENPVTTFAAGQLDGWSRRDGEPFDDARNVAAYTMTRTVDGVALAEIVVLDTSKHGGSLVAAMHELLESYGNSAAMAYFDGRVAYHLHLAMTLDRVAVLMPRLTDLLTRPRHDSPCTAECGPDCAVSGRFAEWQAEHYTCVVYDNPNSPACAMARASFDIHRVEFGRGQGAHVYVHRDAPANVSAVLPLGDDDATPVNVQ